MNVIFLDILSICDTDFKCPKCECPDGVLNTPNYGVQAHAMWKRTNGRFKSRDEFGAIFDPMAVDCLEYLVHHTGAKVVVSSTWRKSGFQVMKDLFKFRKIDIIGVTPVLNALRGQEIQIWLQENKHVTNYVILDDNTDFLVDQMDHFVCTKYGFDHNCMGKAFEIFRGVK